MRTNKQNKLTRLSTKGREPAATENHELTTIKKSGKRKDIYGTKHKIAGNIH